MIKLITIDTKQLIIGIEDKIEEREERKRKLNEKKEKVLDS